MGAAYLIGDAAMLVRGWIWARFGLGEASTRFAVGWYFQSQSQIYGSVESVANTK